MRLLFGAIVGILVIAVVAISLSICVFSCRPNAWGLLRGEWLGMVREGLSTSSHSVSNCGFATHHPLPKGHPLSTHFIQQPPPTKLSFRPVCGRRFLATFSACAGLAVFELPPAVD